MSISWDEWRKLLLGLNAANSGVHRTVFRSKTDAMRSERTPGTPEFESHRTGWWEPSFRKLKATKLFANYQDIFTCPKHILRHSCEQQHDDTQAGTQESRKNTLPVFSELDLVKEEDACQYRPHCIQLNNGKSHRTRKKLVRFDKEKQEKEERNQRHPRIVAQWTI